LPHEKADPAIVQRLKDILSPPCDHEEQQMLHVEDEDTTWFGLAKDKDNQSTFEDYGRYSAIMAESNTTEYQSRYPHLVSFIGQTGAGKSTIIKMLIDQQESLHTSLDREWGFPSPVVGSITNGNVPTSGDVHLYSDPTTYHSEYPMLLADCEGLEGGENTPISAQYREKAATTHEGKNKEKDRHKTSSKPKLITKSLNAKQRILTWANCPEKSKRQHAVTELYPRLLYTFSDVVVFVLRNAK
jgi:energy-coupling factor transporter ATP-binding protein EcfA2